MANVRQIAQVALTFGDNRSAAGHLIGISCVIRRLVEYTANGDPEGSKILAEYLRNWALEDVGRLAANGMDKSQAIAAIDQTLLPLIQYEIEH